MNKKLFLSIIGSVTLLTGCSSNDETDGTNNPNGPKILLSKITTVYYDNPANPQTNVATLEYNNQGQLIKILSEGRASSFEYEASGKPIKTNYYKADGTLDYYSTYTYNGEQLTTTKSIYTNPDYNRTITYTYINGKVTGSSLCQGTNCNSPSTSSYAYIGDNISVETSLLSGTFSVSTKREFSNDDKLNPFSHVNKYLRISMGGAYVLSPNNYTSEKISYKDNAGNWVPNQNNTYEMQYNSFQLPTQVIGRDANGNSYVKYNYEYIIQ